MLHRFRFAGALALLVGLTGCAEYGYTQRSSYPAPSRRAPTYDNGGDYDRAPARTADRRVARDAADYAEYVNRNIHLSERQEYAIRDILEDRTYRHLDRGRAYPFPRRNGYARDFWRDADRRIERVLDRYQREYYRHLTGRGERYYRDTYYYDYCYVHYDRFPTRWRSRHNRTYYRSRSRSYRNQRGRYDDRDDRRNGRADRDGNRGRVEGRADHDRNRTRGNREANERQQRERTERRQRQGRTDRQQQRQRTEQRTDRREQRTERRTERPSQTRTERPSQTRTERPSQTRTERPSRQRTERPSRTRTERGSRSGRNGRSSRGRTSRRDG